MASGMASGMASEMSSEMAASDGGTQKLPQNCLKMVCY
jgi:hypothetical protein